ncbi:unnamed protein product [Ixodes persulcatus]
MYICTTGSTNEMKHVALPFHLFTEGKVQFAFEYAAAKAGPGPTQIKLGCVNIFGKGQHNNLKRRLLLFSCDTVVEAAVIQVLSRLIQIEPASVVDSNQLSALEFSELLRCQTEYHESYQQHIFQGGRVQRH